MITLLAFAGRADASSIRLHCVCPHLRNSVGVPGQALRAHHPARVQPGTTHLPQCRRTLSARARARAVAGGGAAIGKQPPQPPSLPTPGPESGTAIAVRAMCGPPQNIALNCHSIIARPFRSTPGAPPEFLKGWEKRH